MSFEEMVAACSTTNRTKEYYIKLKNEIYGIYDSLSEEEQYVMSDALEELEMTIEWMV